MLNGLVHAHSGLRWVVLILLIWTILSAFLQWQRAENQNSVKKTAFYALIFTHIQALLGLVLYFTSTKVDFTAEFMKDKVYRFFMVEHATLMLLAIILITVGYSRSKKAANYNKTIFWFYLAGLLLILLSIPWPWMGYGTKWF